jgi:hypothetical protein
MVVMAGLAGLIIGAVAGWGLAQWHAAVARGRLQALLRTRIGYWHEEAERARATAARVSEQAAAWAAGCQHGREEVLSLAHDLAQAARATSGPAH